MADDIQSQVAQRGITRLCHFTPSRKLAHIAVDSRGLLATRHLEDSARDIFNFTDLQRLDGHKDDVCCSIEYPNAWYFDQARAKEQLFRDWVVLLISPRYLWMPGTKFCPRNAASNFGRDIEEGPAAFERLFAPSVVGAGGRTFVRGPLHLPCSPTDDQAEVLVPDQIGRDDILGIAAQSEEQARRETTRLSYIGAPRFKIVVAPDLFDKRRLSTLIRVGRRPNEAPFTGV